MTVRKEIVPGNPAESRLYQLITSAEEEKRMPPKAYDRLTPDEIDTIRQWISEGAPPFPKEK